MPFRKWRRSRLKFFLTGHPVVLRELKDNNKFVSLKHNNMLLFNLLATSFGH
jgi:hypothetical protein